MPCWLLKAEPETRIEKGKDVKFSVDDFKQCKVSLSSAARVPARPARQGTYPSLPPPPPTGWQVTQWEGVRNHEAKNLMKDKMRVGDKALFYASNCKVSTAWPGHAARRVGARQQDTGCSCTEELTGRLARSGGRCRA